MTVNRGAESEVLIGLPKVRVRAQWRSWLLDYAVPGVLFTMSVGTTMAIGARFMQNFMLGLPTVTSEDDLWPWPWLMADPHRFLLGWPFSVALLGILLSHEFGHYFACRAHRIGATVPWVLPAPTLSGTIGAVIRIRDRIPNPLALMDVGAYGPIFGYLASLTAVAWGFLLSRPMAPEAPHDLIRFSTPLTFDLMHHAMLWIRPDTPAFAVANRHPALIAGWIGLFITSLNLIPAGQLDGGHIVYALSPRVHKVLTRLSPVFLLVMGYYLWIGWLLWGLLLLIPIMRHPRVITEKRLGKGRLVLSFVALVLFVLSFSAQPFDATSLWHYLHN